MRENKNVDEVVMTATEEDTNKLVKDLEEQDKKSEKQKKKLKRKVVIRNIVIVALLAIIIILLLRGCSSGVGEALINRIPQLEDSELIDQTKSTEIPRIDIPVVTDASVSADQPYVNFYNPETNADKYYLQYEVYDENAQLIYQSKMVEAGKKFSANLYDAFSGVAGQHSCNVRVRTFKVGTLAEVNGINNDVIFTVK